MNAMELERFDPVFEEQPADYVQERIRLAKRRAQLEDEVERIKGEVAALDAKILAAWEQSETNRITAQGSTLYLYPRRYAKVLDEDALAAALRREGLGAIVKEGVNTSTLTATLKELADTAGLPESFAGIVELRQTTVLRQKNAG